MSLRLVSFGFASALLLIAGTPAFANSSDNGVVQDAEVTTVITGSYNDVRTGISQTSDNNRRSFGSTGVSQTGRANTDILGDGNSVRKNIKQRSGNNNQ
jgi:hypothetical protein